MVFGSLYVFCGNFMEILLGMMFASLMKKLEDGDDTWETGGCHP